MQSTKTSDPKWDDISKLVLNAGQGGMYPGSVNQYLAGEKKEDSQLLARALIFRLVNSYFARFRSLITMTLLTSKYSQARIFP